MRLSTGTRLLSCVGVALVSIAAASPSPGATQVGPLLSTSWHEEAPYNDDCPLGDGGVCLVGSPAVAAAQILRYHSWPAAGYDGHWFPNTGAPAEDFRLEAGEGYLYRNREPQPLAWEETRPYTLP